uniref:Uncharacterized protein n=1 Tax=Romanomermis culicivorax TaxID=13658 RepID=A0A915IG55_ROMCU
MYGNLDCARFLATKPISTVTIVYPGSTTESEAMNDAQPPPESPSTSDQSVTKLGSPKVKNGRQSRVNSVTKKFRRPPHEQQGRTTPYWLRGNPQPLTGVRGCPMYNAAFGGLLGRMNSVPLVSLIWAIECAIFWPTDKSTVRRPMPDSRNGYLTGKEDRLRTNGTLYKVTKYRSVNGPVCSKIRIEVDNQHITI